MADFVATLPEDAEPDPEFNNLPIKPVDGVKVERQRLTPCYGCTRSLHDHKCFRRMMVTEGAAKAVDDAVAEQHALAEHVRQLQAQISMMQIVGHGISDDYDTNLYESPSANMSVVAVYEVASAGGSTVTLRLHEGATSPLAFYSPSQFGPYGMSIPAQGVLTFSAASLITHHAGFRFYKLDLAGRTHLGVGDTFTVHVDGNVGSAMTVFPSTLEGNDRKIFAFLRFYDIVEPWYKPRNFYPFKVSEAWSEQVGDLAAIRSAEGAFQLASSQISTPGPANEFFQALISKDDQHWEDVTNVAKGYLEINNASSWLRLNLSAEADALTWIEDGYTRIKARFRTYDEAGWKVSGSRQCARCEEDFTGSYGRFYCAAGPEAASGFGSFTDHCCQTGCSAYLADDPASYANLSLAISQLMVSFPWRVMKDLFGMRAFRWGTPSLASLTDNLPGVPVGPGHATIWNDNDCGAWPAIITSGSAVYHLYGLNCLHVGGGLIGDDSTWGPAGPGAMNTTSDYLDETLTDDNDPHRVGRSMVMRSQSDVHCHWGYLVGNFGYYQTFRDAVLYAPNLVGPLTEGLGYKYETGMWDENFEPCDESSAVYYWRLSITEHASGCKTLTTDPGAVLYPSIIAEHSEIIDGMLAVDLRNRKVRASSITSPGSEYETEWLSGGTNVPIHENLRLINWLCDESLMGPRRNLVWPGMCAVVRGRRYWIAKAEPFGGTESSWIPYDFANAGKIHPLGACCVWLPFANQTGAEWATSVQIADILYNTGTWSGGEGKPMPAAGAVDSPLAAYEYCWENVTVGGVRGVAVYLSNKNTQENNFFRVARVYIRTNGSTVVGDVVEWVDGQPDYGYNPSFEVDLKTHSVWGSDHVLPITISALGTPTSVDAVTVTTRELGSDGEPIVRTLHEVPYGDWHDLHDFHIFGYHAEIVGTQIRLIVHPYWARETVSVSFSVEAGADEGQFYHDHVSMHPGLPADYGAEVNGKGPFGNRRDRISLVNEQEQLTGLALEGEAIQVSYDGKGSPDQPTVKRSRKGAASDTLIPASDLAWFGADGTLFGKTRLPSGTCLIVAYKAADRNCFRGHQEINNVATVIERVQGRTS